MTPLPRTDSPRAPVPPPSVAEALTRVTQRQFFAGKRSAHIFARSVRKYLLPRFGALQLTDITSRDIELFVGELRQHLQPSSINGILGPLRAAFKLYARECGLLFPEVVLLETRNAREVFFERQEFERVVNELPGSLRAPMWFAYYTGWRLRSEVLTLRWDEHIKWDAGLVILPANRTKNKRKKEFPFAALPAVEALLREQHRQAQRLSCPWVFFRARGTPIRNCYRAWHAACCRALGPGRRVPHDLRRTAARNLQHAGVSDSIILDLCGWSTVAMLRRYLGATPTHTLHDAVAKLARE